MDTCLWNGRVYNALEVANDYELEKVIRAASRSRMLRCPDKECKSPILKYCNGEKKGAYFAHISNNDCCDYAIYDNGMTAQIRNVKKALFGALSGQGHKVQMDVKLISRHYTNILITYSDNNSKLAIELVGINYKVDRVRSLEREYNKEGISVKWIVVDESLRSIREDGTYSIKRYLLNESISQDLLVVCENCTDVGQYKLYEFCESIGRFEVKKKCVIPYRTIISNIKITEDNLELIGFESYVDECVETKRQTILSDLQNKIKAEENQQREIEGMIRNAEKEANLHADIDVMIAKNKKVYEEICIDDIDENEQMNAFFSKDIVIVNRESQRLYMCVDCGDISTEEEFVSYRMGGYLNLGRCGDCTRKMR